MLFCSLFSCQVLAQANSTGGVEVHFCSLAIQYHAPLWSPIQTQRLLQMRSAVVCSSAAKKGMCRSLFTGQKLLNGQYMPSAAVKHLVLHELDQCACLVQWTHRSLHLEADLGLHRRSGSGR